MSIEAARHQSSIEVYQFFEEESNWNMKGKVVLFCASKQANFALMERNQSKFQITFPHELSHLLDMKLSRICTVMKTAISMSHSVAATNWSECGIVYLKPNCLAKALFILPGSLMCIQMEYLHVSHGHQPSVFSFRHLAFYTISEVSLSSSVLRSCQYDVSAVNFWTNLPHLVTLELGTKTAHSVLINSSNKGTQCQLQQFKNNAELGYGEIVQHFYDVVPKFERNCTNILKFFQDNLKPIPENSDQGYDYDSNDKLNFFKKSQVYLTKFSMGLMIFSFFFFLMFTTSFAAHPDLNVVIENGSKSYECSHEGAVTFQWKFNSSIITSFDAGVDIYDIPPYGFLILNPIPLSWNNTIIQCFANFGKNSSILSFQDMLYVQGVPAPVHNMTYFLKGGILSISWVPSFKLMLKNDFSLFCINVYSHISDTIQENQCGIEASNYFLSSDLKNLSCGDYSVEVIAQNIVGYSTPSSQRIWNKELHVSDIVVTALNHTGFKKVQFFMEMDICFSRTELLVGNLRYQNFDNSEPDIFQLMLDGDEMFEVFLYYSSSHLHSNSSIYVISTFDLISTVVTSIPKERYLIKSSFVANSNVRGVLYAIMFTDDDGNEDYSRSLYLCASLGIAVRGITMSIPDGSYLLLSYDIDNNNFLHTVNSPANISQIVVTNSICGEGESYRGNCTLQQSKKIVNFSCACSERHLYYVVLQERSTYVINSYLLNCSKELTMKLNVSQYHIIVFFEKSTSLLANASPYYTQLFTVEDTDDTTDEAKVLEPNTLSTGTILGILFSVFLIICATFWIVIYLVRLNMKRRRLQNTESEGQRDTQNQEPAILLNSYDYNEKYDLSRTSGDEQEDSSLSKTPL